MAARRATAPDHDHPHGPDAHGSDDQGPDDHAHGPDDHAHGPDGHAHGPDGHAHGVSAHAHGPDADRPGAHGSDTDRPDVYGSDGNGPHGDAHESDGHAHGSDVDGSDTDGADHHGPAHGAGAHAHGLDADGSEDHSSHAPGADGHHHPSPEAHRAAVDAALAALRDAGGRITDGRRAIVTAVLAGEDHHVTADELAAALRADHPTLAVSTIYRTLEALEERGIVARVDLGQGRAVYHPIDHAHHHLVCTTCGAVEEVPDEALAPLAADLRSRIGFALARQQLTLTGTCRACGS